MSVSSVKNAKMQRIHNRIAPFWAVTLIIFCTTGISTTWFDFGPFWKGYVLDTTGPAWTYLLVRGLYTEYRENKWSRFFTPIRTFVTLATIAFLIEFAQYLEIYKSTFDPFDLVAYLALLFPVFIVDLSLVRIAKREENSLK